MKTDKIALGGIWLDDCRIPYQNDDDKNTAEENAKHLYSLSHNEGCVENNFGGISFLPDAYTKGKSGRFPANLLVSDDILNDGNITTATGNPIHAHSLFKGWKKVEGENIKDRICDSGSYSRYFDLDAWYKKVEEN